MIGPAHRERELQPYQDEPLQQASGTSGKKGYIRLWFGLKDRRSILRRFAHQMPLQVQRALYWDEGLPQMPYVFILSPTGGVVQGDRLEIEINMEANAMAHVTTQSATRVYEMDANYATQDQRIYGAPGSYLEYVPDVIIPNRQSRFLSTLELTLAETAAVFYPEIVMPGRMYKDGEIFQYDMLSSSVRVRRPCGTEVFTERTVIEPRKMRVNSVGRMSAYVVFANIYLLGSASVLRPLYEEIPGQMEFGAEWAEAASWLPDDAGIVYKVVGMNSVVVLDRMRWIWTEFRQAFLHVGLPTQRKY